MIDARPRKGALRLSPLLRAVNIALAIQLIPNAQATLICSKSQYLDTLFSMRMTVAH